MKRLILAPLLLTLLVASCSTKKKYNSFREAKKIYKTPSHMYKDWGIYGKGFRDDKDEVKKNFYY